MMTTQSFIPAGQLADLAKDPFPGASDAYRDARFALLAEEIEFRRHMTRLAGQRRALPPGLPKTTASTMRMVTMWV